MSKEFCPKLVCSIHNDGPVNPLRPDLSGWYLQIVDYQ